MNRAGAMGRYQLATLFLSCLMVYMGGGLMFMPSFIFFQDAYRCEESLTAKECLDYVCTKPPSERAWFVPQHPLISSAASKFGDYRCPS